MDKRKPIKITKKSPDLSNVKPPTKTGAEMMITNLHKKAKNSEGTVKN